MNTTELNAFIKNYLKNNKTNSAIMLTAPWGTGKSYYIRNELIPYLKKDEYKCAVVSLYGLNTLYDINKNLYIEIRFSPMQNWINSRISPRVPHKVKKAGREIVAGAVGIGKTIIKGIAGVFNVNIDVSQNDIAKLYKSIDLTNHLIIFEDLERSSIDLIEFMGYVNNLTEHDGIKVLIVTNEQEMLNSHCDDITTDDEKFSPKAKKYLKIKEKTISDTIQFTCPDRLAISNIINSFDNKYFNQFLQKNDNYGESELVSEVMRIMNDKKINSHNLRAFTYSCQKTNDMFFNLDRAYDLDFLKHIFLANVAFVLQKKKKDNLTWTKTDEILASARLGTINYPLYKFSYDYINYQYLDLESLQTTENHFCEQRNIENQNNELATLLKPIYNYYHSTEKAVIQSVKKVTDLLENSNDIPFIEYGKLCKHLILLKYRIGCNNEVDRCKSAMQRNIQNLNESMELDLFYRGEFDEIDSSLKEEYITWQALISNLLNQKNRYHFDFDYNTNSLPDFFKFVSKDKNIFVAKRAFANKFELDKLIQLLEKCTSEQISQIRRMFGEVYSFSNLHDFFMDDKDSLLELQQKLLILHDRTDTKLDKIQLLQLEWFVADLQEYIDRL